MIQTIEKNRIRDAVRKEINIANAIAIAEEILKEDTQEPPTDAIEDDWLYRWRDYAANFSSEKLQEIWGKALAGELKTPGSYSIRCLEFLKNLSQEEANIIEKLSAFTFENSIWRGKLELLEEKGLSFDILLDMQELGIISGVNSTGLHLKWPSPINPNFYVTLVSNGKVLIVKHEDPSKLPYIKTFKITSIGQQVFSLGKFEPNIEYLEALGKTLKDQGFNVTIADVKEISKDNLIYGNEHDL